MRNRETQTNDAWIRDIEARIDEFAKAHGSTYSRKKREQSAIFEIGCFLALADDYVAQGFVVTSENLALDGSFRYLTSPSGNPANFSYLVLTKGGQAFELRQQIRIRSHLHVDVTFTPDLVVFERGAKIDQKRDVDYAGGKRGLFALSSENVIAFHECKSLPGFPELYVSFLGMLLAVHSKFAARATGTPKSISGHLASALFVGGESSNLHVRMIVALQEIYVMNIITGLHRGGWILARRRLSVARLSSPR